ncbi:FAD-binding oxidoreductase [Kutzneria sp. CA-103260]|uniref:FAD-binding oxidoreductase n=1 Tax=Kutzneria sp. CA-103260 TaxID=2802641 RepID=UPI001BA94458|nr:FAD-dependent oxidoreductase [Kutzneria sp. CA-103260]QUQ66632.1 4-cresol dehydrogenase [hydroxylating] flavoprotein subunit [Kutzneria sp. CA-103260]
MTRHLPPDMDQDRLDRALAELRSALGAKWVLSDESELVHYQDPCPIYEADHFSPSAAVLPGSVEDVQATVRIATEHGLPLSPISTGKNLGFGGAAPRLPGAVVVDLKRMNRILEVDEKFGYALVEPGVSYFELYDHLRARGSKLMLDVPDLGWGGIIGNTLERGVGYTPYGDHLSIQCGMEVVLADGDVVRTGMGALPGSNTWQLFKYGYGPQFDPMFTQSNYGIVTKLGIWLMPEPAGCQAYMITLPREEDLGAVVDAVRPLRLNGTIPNVPTLRSLLLDAAAVGPRSRFFTGAGPVPDSVARRIADEHGIGQWNFYGALYGPPAVRAATWEVIRDAFAGIPGAGFHFEGEHPSPVLAARAKIMAGQPNLDTYKILQWHDNGGHIDFAPVSPATAEDAMRQYEMARDRCREAGKDYMGNFIVGRREMHHICMLMFDTADPADRVATLDLCRTLIREAAELGYGEYRVHPALMDEIAATFSFNDNALLRLSEKIKDALDPAGVLAPGKQGIWPRRLRGRNL